MKFSLRVAATALNKKLITTDALVLSGHIYFFLMLVLSLVFYKERLLSMDSAYYSFRLIIEETFYAGHQRAISYLPQVLPLLALKMGCSLKTFLMVYSASFILFYYLIYNIVVYLFRNPAAGLFLVLALGLTLRYKFYGPVGEVILSMGYLTLLVGWMTKPAASFKNLPPWLDIVMACLIASLLVTAHPFITVGVVIFLGFDLLYHKKWQDFSFWVIALYTGAILCYRFVFTTRNTYEAERIGRMNESWAVLSNLQDYYVTEIIMRFFDTQYHLPFLAFVGVIVFMLFKKRIVVALYLSFSFIAVLAVVLIMHAYLTNDVFIMLDGYLAYLGLVWAIPLAFVWGKENRVWSVLLLSVLMLFSLDRIRMAHDFFSHRMVYLETLMAEHTDAEHPKAILQIEDYNFNEHWLGWALSFETLMLSSLDDPGKSRTIFFSENKGQWDSRLGDSTLFLNVSFGPEFFKHDQLPPRFFLLPQLPYKKISIQ